MIRRWSLALALSLGLGGCTIPASPESALRPDDCMKATSINAMAAAIAACNAVIHAYPHHALPFRDRALLWSLNGDERRACQDLRHSLALAERRPAENGNQRLRSDLRISLRACQGSERQP